MKRFLIVIEKTRTGYSAYSPDLDGCVATGATKKAVEKAMRESIKFHLEGMKIEGLKVPSGKSYSTYLEVRAA
jgi:predicted RNase H-like HicB family nuclease